MKRTMKANQIGSTGSASSFRAVPPSGEGWRRTVPYSPPRSARAAGCSRPGWLSWMAAHQGVLCLFAALLVGAAAIVVGRISGVVFPEGSHAVGLLLGASVALLGYGIGWEARSDQARRQERNARFDRGEFILRIVTDDDGCKRSRQPRREAGDAHLR